MKKFYIITVFMFVLLVSFSQNYTVQFVPTNSADIIDSIKVLNMSTNLISTIPAGINMHLVGSTAVVDIYASKLNLKISPNPAENYAEIEFYAESPDNMRLEVFEISGKKVFQHQEKIDAGNNSYNLKNIGKGLFLVKVSLTSQIYTAKLCSNSTNSNSNISLEKGVSENLQHSIQHVKSQYSVDVPYTVGDRLLMTGFSGKKKTILTDIFVGDKIINYKFLDCVDGDGYSYPVVFIGTQAWMGEHLKTTRYNDGNKIYNSTLSAEWKVLTGPAYCWYKNDSVTYCPYGAYYNWYAATTSNISPVGWRVPSNADWTKLIDFLGGKTVAGGYIKETGTTHWLTPNLDANNITGFTSMPSGHRTNMGAFSEMAHFTRFWTTEQISDANGYDVIITYSNASFNLQSWQKTFGFTIRCVKDL